MPIEITMPALSPTMKEGNLAKWVKKEGEKVEAGEIIAEIETDKATMEVEAVDEGILAKLIIPEGSENIAVHSTIAILLEDGETAEDLKDFKISSKDTTISLEKNQDTQKKSENTDLNKGELKTNNSTAKIINDTESMGQNDKIKASPIAKRIAKAENINLNQVNGSGPRGRIVKEDVLELLNSGATKNIVRRNTQDSR